MTPICGWCLGSLRLADGTPRQGWIEVISPVHGRVAICRDCWYSAEQMRIIEALGMTPRKEAV